MAQRIKKRQAINQDSFAFPTMPGSHLELKNPALEFAKSVCQVGGESFVFLENPRLLIVY